MSFRLLFWSLFFLFIATKLLAQQDSIYQVGKKEGLYRMTRHGKWAATAETIVLIPEIHGFKHLALGLNIARGSFGSGEGGMTGEGYQVGLEYLPFEGIIAPKVKAWKAGWAFILGGNIGISGLYYLKKDASSFAFRPEIGLGVVYLQFNYGYTFFANKKFEDLSPHTFSVSWIHTILPRKKK